jgi:hypothetical protein
VRRRKISSLRLLINPFQLFPKVRASAGEPTLAPTGAGGYDGSRPLCQCGCLQTAIDAHKIAYGWRVLAWLRSTSGLGRAIVEPDVTKSDEGLSRPIDALSIGSSNAVAGLVEHGLRIGSVVVRRLGAGQKVARLVAPR